MNHRTNISLAALALGSGHGIGLTSLSLQHSAEGTWQQLLPAGYFSAVDGRPEDVPSGKWFLDSFHAQQLILLAQSAKNDLVIDYEHQTLHKEMNGQPAPAAGWFKSGMEWRERSGLWILPKWTQKAAEYIRQGEYRFLSAVFTYDKKTGIPQSLHSAALVNRAGLDGMQAITSLSAVGAISSMSLPLFQEEKDIIQKYYVDEAHYQSKRQTFCVSKCKTWTELTSLSAQERRVIAHMGFSEQAYKKTKIEQLAEEVIRS